MSNLFPIYLLTNKNIQQSFLLLNNGQHVSNSGKLH